MDDNEESQPATHFPPGLPAARPPATTPQSAAGQADSGDGKPSSKRRQKASPIVVRWNPQQEPAPETPPEPEPPARPPRSFSKAEDERQRLLQVAGLSSTLGVARIGGGHQLLFRCPACLEQQTCGDHLIGQRHICDNCGSELQIPVPETTDRVILVRTGRSLSVNASAVPVQLPEERGEDGPGGKTVFRPMDEILPEGEDGSEIWGLSKSNVPTADRPKPNLAKPLAGFCLLGALILGLYFLIRSPGRIQQDQAPDPEMVSDAESQANLDWSTLTEANSYLMAEKKIRAYLSAGDVAEMAKHVRGGPAKTRLMAAYYSREGGYEPGIRIHGPIAQIAFGEPKLVRGQRFRMMRVRFAQGSEGIYALALGARDYEVDWEYAVGFGQIAFDQLVKDRPADPVVMRVYLTERFHFTDGFESDKFRCFEVTNATRQVILYAFVPRDSPTERKLVSAWSDAALDLIGSAQAVPDELDFVIRLHYDRVPGRQGFLIDDVLNRGWILPDNME